MKKSVSVMMAIALCAAMVSGCSGSGGQKDTAADTKAAVETTASGAAEKGSEEQTAAAENKKIDKLNVYFVPSREPEEIVTATEPLKEMLKTELAKEGYDIGEVVITVGTSYEAVGEALSAGTADIGLIPGGTYVLYDDGADVILTATRDGLSKNSDSAKDWNDGKATEPTDQQVTSYRALMIAGPSEKAQELAQEIPNSFIPGQFVNPSNPKAHRSGTGPEIYADTDGMVDIFVAGVGTGGTITGVGEYLKARKPEVKVVAVEPEDSPVLSSGRAGAHKIQGIGAGFVPDILNTHIYDEVISISNEAAFAASRLIGKKEGVLVGISSGAAVAAAIDLAGRPEHEGKTIVVLLPDTGDRYLSTSLFAEE